MSETVQESIRKSHDGRMNYEQMLARVPKIFQPYWKELARKNGYYNHRFMVEWADGLEEKLILDAGCGEEGDLAEHEPRLSKVVGLDPLHDCVKANPTPKFKTQAVLEYLPYADNSFDGIYSDSVFEHVVHPKLVIHEFYRVLKPGGRVVINTNSVWNPFMFPNKILSIKAREWIKKTAGIESEGTFPAPYRINTKWQMVSYLKQAGFTNIKIYRWGVPHMYRPKWFLVVQLLMEMLAEVPPFRGLKHRLMATCEKV